MQASYLLGAAALLAGAGLFFAGDVPRGSASSAETAGAAAARPAAGHFVLVVEGDRDHLAVTHARYKPDPWAGVPKGLTSDWALSIRDAQGAEIERVPLDMSLFDLRPESRGKPLRVQGDVVTDTRVGMLVNAPSLAAATSYVFLRGPVVVGRIDALALDQLAEGNR